MNDVEKSSNLLPERLQRLEDKIEYTSNIIKEIPSKHVIDPAVIEVHRKIIEFEIYCSHINYEENLPEQLHEIQVGHLGLETFLMIIKTF